MVLNVHNESLIMMEILKTVFIEDDLEPGRSSSANPFRASKGQVQPLILIYDWCWSFGVDWLWENVRTPPKRRRYCIRTMFRLVGKGRQKENSNSRSPRHLSVRFDFSLLCLIPDNADGEDADDQPPVLHVCHNVWINLNKKTKKSPSQPTSSTRQVQCQLRIGKKVMELPLLLLLKPTFGPSSICQPVLGKDHFRDDNGAPTDLTQPRDPSIHHGATSVFDMLFLWAQFMWLCLTNQSNYDQKYAHNYDQNCDQKCEQKYDQNYHTSVFDV